MKVKGVNAASKKTVDLIKGAFAELMEEKKEIEAISVTELVKRINITRGAFYSHYSNIYEVAEELQDELLEHIIDFEDNISSQKEMEDYFDRLFEFLKEHQDMYCKLLMSDEALMIMNRLNKKICNVLSKMINNKKRELDILFFTNGSINLIVKFFRNEIEEDLDELCAYVKKMAIILFY